MPLGGIGALYVTINADTSALRRCFGFSISASVNMNAMCDRYGGASGGLTRVCQFLSSPDGKTDVPQRGRGGDWCRDKGRAGVVGDATGCILRPRRPRGSTRVCGGER